MPTRGYRRKSSSRVLWTLFFAILTQVFAYQAQTDQGGLSFNDHVWLGPEKTVVLFWALAGVCAILALGCLLSVAGALRARRRT